MASRRARFSAIPSLPQTGISDWQVFVLSALKENVEQLIGAKDTGNKAVISGSITVESAPPPNMPRVTATGAGFNLGGSSVPSLEDYGQLVLNVQTLADDLAAVRNTLNVLIAQIKG